MKTEMDEAYSNLRKLAKGSVYDTQTPLIVISS
jgi:hypothetical protein